jgi:hypothetical protein
MNGETNMNSQSSGFSLNYGNGPILNFPQGMGAKLHGITAQKQ